MTEAGDALNYSVLFNPIFGFLIIKCWMKYAE